MFNVRLAGGHLYGKQLLTWLSLVVSLMASFVLSFFPLDVLDEIWDLIESVSEGFFTYSCRVCTYEVIHTFWNVDCITCPTLCKWAQLCILSLLKVCYTVLVPVLDNHVSDEQVMSLRNLKEWQYINHMCFEAYQAI